MKHTLLFGLISFSVNLVFALVFFTIPAIVIFFASSNGANSIDTMLTLVKATLWGLFIAPLGLIPAVLINLKLSEYLRNRRSWTILYPIRAILVSFGLILLPALYLLILFIIG